MDFTINNQTYYCATALRVIYTFGQNHGYKTIQESLEAIQKLGTEDQMDLLYLSYISDTRNVSKLDKDTFIGNILDNYGILKLSELISNLVDGLLYAGYTPEEVQSKKEEIQKTQVGMTSLNTQED